MINRTAVACLCICLLACTSLRASGVVDENTEQKFDVGPNPTLTVRNTDGRVLVYGSAENQIVVKTYKRAFSKERLTKIDASVSLVGNDMVIETKIAPPDKGLLADRSGTVEYTVLVPQHCAVKVEQAQGEMHFEWLRGPSIEAHQTNGRINLRSCFSPATVTLDAGGIDAGWNWWEDLPITMSFEVRRGGVTIALPTGVALRLDAETASGHIRNELPKQGPSKGSIRQLKTALGVDGKAAIKVRVDNGNIRLRKAY